MRILITGGTNGMGKGVAKVLASMGNQKHEIIILCRSEELGKKTIEEIEKETLNKRISIVFVILQNLVMLRKQ